MIQQRKTRQLAPILIPPNGFLTIETNLHRALEPILPEHLLFLKKLKLGYCIFFLPRLFFHRAILVVSNSPLNETILSFVDDHDGIAIVCRNSETLSSLFSSSLCLFFSSQHSITTDSSTFISNVHLSEDWIKRALELLLSMGQETVLLLGRSTRS